MFQKVSLDTCASRDIRGIEAKSYGAITPLARIAVGQEANALAGQFVSWELKELEEEKETNQ